MISRCIWSCFLSHYHWTSDSSVSWQTVSIVLLMKLKQNFRENWVCFCKWADAWQFILKDKEYQCKIKIISAKTARPYMAISKQVFDFDLYLSFFRFNDCPVFWEKVQYHRNFVALQEKWNCNNKKRFSRKD